MDLLECCYFQTKKKQFSFSDTSTIHPLPSNTEGIHSDQPDNGNKMSCNIRMSELKKQQRLKKCLLDNNQKTV